MHYISFTFKQSLTALSNACSSAFNLFLSFLFTSTYSHRCYHYFSTFIVEERTKTFIDFTLFLYFFSVYFYILSPYTCIYFVLGCCAVTSLRSGKARAHTHQAKKSLHNNQEQSTWLLCSDFYYVVSTHFYNKLKHRFVSILHALL